MKKLLLLLVLILGLLFGLNYYQNHFQTEPQISQVVQKKQDSILIKKVSALNTFISNHAQYNNEIAFLIDMRIPSSQYRFYVYDLKIRKILKKGLVAHGSGSETKYENVLSFSNQNGSNATSLGKYSIGTSYWGKFGKSYKLYGLDKSNSNAFERAIVLHHYESVPRYEQPTNIINSLGCPMVNKVFFQELENILDNSSKPILMEIYY